MPERYAQPTFRMGLLWNGTCWIHGVQVTNGRHPDGSRCRLTADDYAARRLRLSHNARRWAPDR